MKLGPIFQSIIRSIFPGKEEGQAIAMKTNLPAGLKAHQDYSTISQESKDIHFLSNSLTEKASPEIKQIYSDLLKSFDQRGETERFINLCQKLADSDWDNQLRSFEIASQLDQKGVHATLWFQNMENMNDDNIHQYLNETAKIISQNEGSEINKSLMDKLILSASSLNKISTEADQENDLLGKLLQGINKFEAPLDKMDYISLFFKATQ